MDSKRQSLPRVVCPYTLSNIGESVGPTTLGRDCVRGTRRIKWKTKNTTLSDVMI
jgi:hypothetical protein